MCFGHLSRQPPGNLETKTSLRGKIQRLDFCNVNLLLNLLQMTSFGINPFSWCEGDRISGSVGSLSLTKMNGSVITVANLTEEIEVKEDCQQVSNNMRG